MTEIQAEPSTRPAWLKLFGRVAALICVAFCIGWTLNRISGSLEKSGQPAGFNRGVLQGALMPMAMPNLLFGRDVTIYAAHNTGRNYKLGYTLGVNACGAIFFGYFFWRVRHWRHSIPRAI
jgi:hypothetical protein